MKKDLIVERFILALNVFLFGVHIRFLNGKKKSGTLIFKNMPVRGDSITIGKRKAIFK